LGGPVFDEFLALGVYWTHMLFLPLETDPHDQPFAGIVSFSAPIFFNGPRRTRADNEVHGLKSVIAIPGTSGGSWRFVVLYW
jgi:hypothetical protein